MCLDVVYRGKQKKESLAKLPDEFPVWKMVRVDLNGKYRPLVFGTTTIQLYCGEMVAASGRYPVPSYKLGWHANPSRSGTREFARANGWSTAIPEQYDAQAFQIIKCLAKKKHIVAIGSQDGHVVVVLSHITFPKKCGKAKK